jgi:uncharacterized membrane protein YkoI
MIAKSVIAFGATALLLAAEAVCAAETQVTIERAAAEKIALAQVPSGQIQEGELEQEHGRLVWSFDIAQPQSKNIIEVQVDALNGKVLSVETETPADQAKEAAADRAAKAR